MADVQDKPFMGKVALFTGGSKGIGAGIVRRLASDGASVAFTFSSSKEKALKLVRELESGGGKALAMKADSASAEELRAAVTETVETFGLPRRDNTICFLPFDKAHLLYRDATFPRCAAVLLPDVDPVRFVPIASRSAITSEGICNLEAARFSRRCAREDVPGISRILADR